jgi:hypothetical protein
VNARTWHRRKRLNEGEAIHWRLVPASRIRKAMDTSQILQDLRRQRDQLNEAILALERLAAGAGPRLGRPPKWLAVAKTADAPKRRRTKKGHAGA